MLIFLNSFFTKALATGVYGSVFLWERTLIEVVCCIVFQQNKQKLPMYPKYRDIKNIIVFQIRDRCSELDSIVINTLYGEIIISESK